MRLVCALAASILMSGAFAQSAGAQDWQRGRQWQPPPQSQPGPPRPGGGGGACVPSGFARLTRNCSVNTGACQRMPDSCNRGWCCP
jgi:hypothetical protein